MIISVNGSLKNAQEAVVSVYDHGFLYGMGVFETFRTYAGRPFMLEAHLRRLAEGCRQLSIAYEPDAAAVRRTIGSLLEANGLDDAYFRLTVTGGDDVLGLPGNSYGSPTVIMYVKPLPAADSSVYGQGRSLQLLQLPRSTPEGPFRLKSLHYMNNILAKRELNRYAWARGAEGLFLNDRGYVTEGIVSNVFFVRDDTVHTPSPETGLLAGITRQCVIDLLRDERRNVSEGLYTWADLLQSDEVFITNSIQEIVPITKLFDPDGQSYTVGDGLPGKWTKTLIARYRERVAQATS